MRTTNTFKTWYYVRYVDEEERERDGVAINGEKIIFNRANVVGAQACTY